MAQHNNDQDTKKSSGPLGRLREAFARFVETYIVTEEPASLDDEANYGYPAHYIACQEGCHPAVAKGLIDRLEQWGRGTTDVKEMHARVKPQLAALDQDSYIDMLRANLATAVVQERPRPRPRM